MTTADWQERLERDGFFLLPRVFTADHVERLRERLAAALQNAAGDAGSIRSRGGIVYAARNVISLWPEVADVWRCELLPTLLTEILGPDSGLVRGLFFDKPPGRSWSLPWHRDRTIAVERNDLPTARLAHPTHKAGVPHVEAPRETLGGMLTLRIHLDDVTAENGPLLVIPGSHRTDSSPEPADRPPVAILAHAGDVLAVRPLISHSSGNSTPGTARHRRVLHLEFAADRRLPDGYRWRWFRPVLIGSSTLPAPEVQSL